MTQSSRASKFGESFLFSGNPLFLSDTVSVKHPKIKDTLDIGNSINPSEIYWHMVGELLCDPYDNMVMLDDLGIDYEEVTPWEVFLINWNSRLDDYNNKKDDYDAYGVHPLDYIKISLSFFLGKHDYDLTFMKLAHSHNEEIVLIASDAVKDNECNFFINKDMFNLMSDFIFSINCLDTSDRINPSNKNAKKMLIEDMRDELKRKQRKNLSESDTKDHIGIFSKSLAFGGNGGVNVFNYKELSVYQLFCGMKVTDKKEIASHILSGMYSGNVKSESVNTADINWKE